MRHCLLLALICFAGTVMALSEQSARDKGCQLVGVSASAYTGKARRLVEVVRR